MPQISFARLRKAVPLFAIAALTIGASAASATLQPKPEIRIEGQRSAQGAMITIKGKNWPANARVKIVASRAPGANGMQDFGIVSADSMGVIPQFRKTVPCTTTAVENAKEFVTFTAVDSMNTAKATAKIDGSSWVCF